ncbi:hypothetical protein DPMN_076954 [Dreissena polymorpha]|uniref:Uncharacterized protein n=1 Tax=Dreissena polymorpha TaxID=45954 RepID=A0A9D4BP55_DREPO|nr:hypothetical protein DPMN_076954 [Dreissena polymorpha]
MNIDDYLSDSVKSTENPLNRFSKDIKISLDREMSKLITIDDCSCNPECTTVNTPTGDVLAKYVSIPAEQGMTEVITMEEYSSFPCDSIDEQCFGNEVISTEHREEIIYIRNPKDLSVPDEFCMSRRTDSNIFPEYPDLTASERNFLCDDYEIFEEKGAHEMYELDDDYLSDIPDSDERKPKAHQSGPALIAKVTAGQGMLEINDDDYPSICPGLWRALCGTNTEYLKLRICHPSNNDDSVIQSETLSSLSKLHTLDICRYYDCPNVWSAVCDVNIRNLSLDLRGTDTCQYPNLELQMLTKVKTLRLLLYEYTDFHLPDSVERLFLMFTSMSTVSLSLVLNKLITTHVKCELMFCYNEPLDEYTKVKEEVAATATSCDISFVHYSAGCKKTDEEKSYFVGRSCFFEREHIHMTVGLYDY